MDSGGSGIPKGSSLLDDIDLLRKEGDRAYETGDWNTALSKYKAMTALGLSLNVKEALAEGYRKSAHVERLRGNYRKAEKHYDKALDISRILGDRPGVADSLRGVSYMKFRRGEYGEALRYDELALEQAKGMDDGVLKGKILIDIGNVHNAEGRYDVAMRYYNEALDVLPSSEFFQRGRVFNNIGEIHKRMGKYDEALESLETLIREGEEVGDTNNVAWAMFSAAECHLRKEDVNRAEDYINRSEDLLLLSSDDVGLQELLKVKGMVYSSKGERAKAKTFFEESIVLGKRLDLPPETASTYVELGRMLEEEGDKTGAEACYRQACALYAVTGLQKELAEATELKDRVCDS